MVQYPASLLFNRYTEITCNVMYGFLQIYYIMIVAGIESGPMPKLICVPQPAQLFNFAGNGWDTHSGGIHRGANSISWPSKSDSVILHAI